MKKKTKLDLVRVRSVISDTQNIDKDAKIVCSERLPMVPSPDVADAMSVYMAYKSWGRPVVTKCKYRPPSTHKRTYKKGSKIRNIATFRKWCMNGGPVYYNHKFMHYGFIVSMPFRAICDALSRGVIWKAVRV